MLSAIAFRSMRTKAAKIRFGVVLAASCFLAGCGASDTAKPPAPPPPGVGTQKAAMKGVSRSYDFVGRIKAINTVQLRARVEGFLEKVSFIEGQDVKAGDVLYQIETGQYQAQVDQAKANLASSTAQLTNAQLAFNRSNELAKNQFAAQSTLDQNRATLDSGKATVLQNQSALAQAELNLSYTTIKAPVDGRIGRTAYTTGNLVNSSSGVLATIVSQDPIYVLFPVSVRELDDIRKERRQENGSYTKIDILVRLPNGQEYNHSGVWNYTDPQVDQQSDTLIMRGTLPNPDRQLVDGQFVTVEVKERKEQPLLVVAQAALQVDQAGSYVLIVDQDHKAQIRRVTTGQTQDANVVIASGLKEGEDVIIAGAQKVRPGQQVDAKPTTPAAGG